MTHTVTSPSIHPIKPYAQALDREHEEALADSSVRRPIVGLLSSQAEASAKTGRVVVVRRAGSAVPFGDQHPRGSVTCRL